MPALPTLSNAHERARAARGGAAALLAALCLCALAPAAPAQIRDAQETPTLDLSKAQVISTLPAHAFGTNMPLDRPVLAWDQKGWKQQLSAAGISVLRFPGGEVSDGYDWRSNTLSTNMAWAEDRGDAESQKMDFRGMLKLARHLGAVNLFFVVNLEGGLRPGQPLREQLERKAQEAAQWVAAVKAEGGFVPYWEIGNETYLTDGFPMTAQEYAEAVSLFARRMKAVDPNIRIGANGPSNWNAQGFMDRLTPQARDAFRQDLDRSRRKCKELKPECREEFGLVPRRGDEGWWSVLARVAGRDIDFGVVHAYYHVDAGAGGQPASLGTPTAQAQGFRSIAEGWREAAGKALPLALTEWNNWPGASALPPHQHFLMAAESILASTAAGVQHSAFWPMRAPPAAERKPFVPLLPRDGSPAHMLQLLGVFNSHFHGEVLSVSGRLSRDTLVLAVRHEAGIELALLNAGAEQRVRVEGASCTRTGSLQVSLVTENGPQPGASLSAPCRDGRLDAFEIPLKSGQLTWVQLTAAKQR